jgi:hypothetical protein
MAYNNNVTKAQITLYTPFRKKARESDKSLQMAEREEDGGDILLNELLIICKYYTINWI